MSNTSLPEDARAFAVAAHREQKYGEHPYAFHLDAVATLAATYGDEAVKVAWLHDVVEDTDATVQQIEARFGPHIASCVALLTDEPGATRKERKARTYAKLALVSGTDELALVVKACDRLANVRACLHDRLRDRWEVYRAEHAVFRRSAYRPGLCDPLWAELDALLAPEAFDARR